MADLTTIAAVKSYAGVTGSGDDSQISAIISAVSSLIAGQIGHDYEGNAVTAEFHTAPFSGSIILRKPAESITAVRVSHSVIAAAGYRLSDGRLLTRLASGLPTVWSGSSVIEVDYLTVSAVPADLELAAREIGAFVLKQSSLPGGGSRLGLSAQANGDTGSADYFVQALKQLPVSRMALRNHRPFA